MATVFHTLSKTTTTTKNPNHKNDFFISCTHRIHNGLKNGPKNFFRGVAPRPLKGLSMSTPTWAYQPKSPLHKLSLKKSPIKYHTTLFQIGSSRQLDQTQLNSTKPNNYMTKEREKKNLWKIYQIKELRLLCMCVLKFVLSNNLCYVKRKNSWQQLLIKDKKK